jgi:acyl-CoA synthetase (AMP-forming)/AMP-acid ligase II
MDGYLGKERFETFERDGWYRTGDFATRSGDGYVFFKGRLGDMIKTSGANVSPREVEEVIKSLTGRPVFVVGIDDPQRGQIVAAAVVVDKAGAVDEAALREKLKERISSYKIPRRFLFLEEAQTPLQSTGKLDKRKLVEMFRAA